VERCGKLRVLYLSNNRIKDYAELDRLAGLGALEDLLLVRSGCVCHHSPRLPAPGRHLLLPRGHGGGRAWMMMLMMMLAGGQPAVHGQRQGRAGAGGLQGGGGRRARACGTCPACARRLLCRAAPRPPPPAGWPARAQVIRRVPQLKKLDGIPVDVDEREQAQAGK
jgi:hypothetical protein